MTDHTAPCAQCDHTAMAHPMTVGTNIRGACFKCPCNKFQVSPVASTLPPAPVESKVTIDDEIDRLPLAEVRALAHLKQRQLANAYRTIEIQQEEMQALRNRVTYFENMVENAKPRTTFEKTKR